MTKKWVFLSLTTPIFLATSFIACGSGNEEPPIPDTTREQTITQAAANLNYYNGSNELRTLQTTSTSLDDLNNQLRQVSTKNLITLSDFLKTRIDFSNLLGKNNAISDWASNIQDGKVRLTVTITAQNRATQSAFIFLSVNN